MDKDMPVKEDHNEATEPLYIAKMNNKLDEISKVLNQMCVSQAVLDEAGKKRQLDIDHLNLTIFGNGVPGVKSQLFDLTRQMSAHDDVFKMAKGIIVAVVVTLLISAISSFAYLVYIHPLP
jgi:hypothetical protein